MFLLSFILFSFFVLSGCRLWHCLCSTVLQLTLFSRTLYFVISKKKTVFFFIMHLKIKSFLWLCVISYDFENNFHRRYQEIYYSSYSLSVSDRDETFDFLILEFQFHEKENEVRIKGQSHVLFFTFSCHCFLSETDKNTCIYKRYLLYCFLWHVMIIKYIFWNPCR